MKHISRLILFMMVLSILIACGASETATEAPAVEATADTAQVPSATDAPDAPAATDAPTNSASGESALARAKAGEFKGTEVSIFGVWVEEDGERFESTLKSFEDETGIDIKFEGSNDFETLITVRVEGNDAPDMAVFPQPGLMARFANDGKLVPLDSFMDISALEENYIPSWIDLGSVDDTLYGVFFRASTKSLVWYPVPAFEEAGYTIPETWDELIALSDQMVADGRTPWCVSIEHGNVTGWVATDWMEDIMLRTAGPDAYDQWVSHDMPFSDPQVKRAAELMGDIWFNEDYVYGGTNGILTIPVADTQTPMFEDEPACWMHRQAGWIPAFFPEGKEAGKDSNFFYFPSIDEAQGRPVLGAGDVVGMFNDRPEVQAVMEYLATPDAAKGWISEGGFISPNNSVSLDWYTNDVDRQQAEIMQNATTFRFDASDLMPAEVGTGTFWSGMVDYVSGEPIDDVLKSIDDTWPTIN